MSKHYDKEVFDELSLSHLICIVTFTNNDVNIGYMSNNDGLCLLPLSIHEPIMTFKRSWVKQIVTFPNGAVFPKNHNEMVSKILDIFTLNDLVNRAGYQFI